jgi:hypothetical protein
MISGTDQLEIINQNINSARSGLDAIHKRKESVNQRLVQLRNQMTEEYRKLARFRLDELTANRVVTQLDQTDRAVLKLLERRAQALQELDTAIEQSSARQAPLNEEREQTIRKRDDLVKQIDEHAAEIKSHLSGQDFYMEQEKRVAEAAAKAERADTKAAQSEADRDEKGKPYRDDPLFMYLWARRFLTPDYTGSGVFRSLDGWVAKIIKYADARSNYYMLTELPVRLREHADRQKEMAAKEVQKLHDMEAKALQVEEIIHNKSALEAAQKVLENIEDRIEAEEEQYDVLVQQRSTFSSGADDISRQAIELQLSEIKHDSLANLYIKAKMTPKPDDDVIVGRIRDLQQEEKGMAQEIEDLKAQEHQHQQAYQELEDLRRQFRRSGYDSRHSYFPGGFELATLLGMLLSGRTSGRDVWGRIDREQKFRRPRTPRDFGGGIFPGGFGGGSRGGGGGIGGGGFRTGGGF